MTKANKRNIKEIIYNKAAEYLFKYGLKGWNMDQLAAETGMAKNTLYKIISYKEEMIEEIFSKKVNKINNDLNNIISNCNYSDENNYFIELKNISTILLDTIKHTESRQAREVFLEYPAVEKEVKEIRENIYSKIIDYLKKGVEKNFLKNNKNVKLYFELLQAFAFYYIKEKNNEVANVEIFNSVEILIDGIRGGVK